MEATEKTIPTREQVEALKADWKHDAWDYDLEDTEGFEAYRDELKAYRLELERQQEEKEEAEYQKQEADLRREFESRSELDRFRLVLWAVERIEALEAKVSELEYRCKS